MNNIKKILGPLFPILMIASTILMVFSLSRLGLALWHLDRVSAVDGWFNIFMSGLRIDIASVCFLLVLPALISSLISAEHRIGQIWNFLLRVWITFGLWFAVYMEVVTPAFIIEYDLRPNRLFIEYLIYPKEVFGMLWSAYKLELAIGLFATIITVFYGWKLSRIVCTNLHYPKWYWRPAIMLLVVLVGTMGARSTLGHRPLNPAMVAFASDPLINDLTLNSSYSVLFAAKQMKSEASAYDYYPKLDDKLVISEIKASMNVLEKDFISADKPTLANHQSQYQGAPKNIVILLLESHGARYVKSLGGIDLSPNLDKLIGEGWAFKRMYASGTRSVRGIEAVTTGFSPTPARAVVKLGKSQTNFFSVARLLKSNQYHTQFIYGGESHFDNMKSFFLGNGFDDMQDFPTFKAPKFVGSWGASDEDLLNKADRQFQQLTEQKKLFFSLVFTSSNHSPFEYPDNTIEQYNEPKQTVENAVKYADYALGKFVAQAKASPYWDNTVFAVIADHDSRTYGASPLPIGHFKIPA
ncbi:MAG: phosphoglycerol transferase MdoB-like AlkP superfamily enzyme, partial [Oceanospirillaceae bacterium]